MAPKKKQEVKPIENKYENPLKDADIDTSLDEDDDFAEDKKTKKKSKKKDDKEKEDEKEKEKEKKDKKKKKKKYLDKYLDKEFDFQKQLLNSKRNEIMDMTEIDFYDRKSAFFSAERDFDKILHIQKSNYGDKFISNLFSMKQIKVNNNNKLTQIK